MARALTSPGATISSADHQFARIRNAGRCHMASRVHFLRGLEMAGLGLPGAPAFPPRPFADGSQAGALAVCCSAPDNQLGALSRSCSSNWYLFGLVDQQSRNRSSSIFSQGQGRSRTRSNGRRVRCVRASAGAGGIPLKPLLDQVLLLGTVFGVYIAGAASLPRLPQLLPSEWPSSARQNTATSQKSNQKQKPKRQSSESSSEDGWSLLQSKLSQALSMETTEAEEEKVVKRPMLGLQAIARVPRLHLLLTTLQHLRKEAG